MENTFLITMESVYNWQSKHHKKVSLTGLRIGSSHFPSSHHIPTRLVIVYDLRISHDHFDVVSGSLFCYSFIQHYPNFDNEKVS